MQQTVDEVQGEQENFELSQVRNTDMQTSMRLLRRLFSRVYRTITVDLKSLGSKEML
jgi:hypothetical protein